MDRIPHSWLLQPLEGAEPTKQVLTRESGRKQVINALHDYDVPDSARGMRTRVIHLLEEYGMPEGYPTVGALLDKERSARRALFIHSHIGNKSADMMFDMFRAHGLSGAQIKVKSDSDSAEIAEALRVAHAALGDDKRKKGLYTRLADALSANGLPPEFNTAGKVAAKPREAGDAIMKASIQYLGGAPVRVSKKQIQTFVSFLNEQGLTQPSQTR